MDSLEFPDRHFARSAEGWLDLGNPSEAAHELRQLSRASENHPDVLELRWQVATAQKNWHAALDLARAVTRIAPGRASGWIHKSFCLHELKRTREARENLLPMVDKFPDNSLIPYNLACYACQLGNMQEARVWIQRTLKLINKEDLRKMALDDPDLVQLHDYLETL